MWAGRLDQSMDQVWREDGNTRWDRRDAITRYSFDIAELRHPELAVVMWEFDRLDHLRQYLAPELAGLDDETLMAFAYRRFLSPQPSLEDEVSRCLGNFVGQLIGVHLRATMESAAQRGQVKVEQYLAVLDKLLRREGVSRLIICTDNREAEEKLLQRYPQAWARHKWFANPGEPLHLNDSCPDKLQAAIDAVVEILLLARCDYLVSVRDSSFSMLSRIMSQAPRENQVQLFPCVSWRARGRRLVQLLVR